MVAFVETFMDSISLQTLNHGPHLRGNGMVIISFGERSFILGAHLKQVVNGNYLECVRPGETLQVKCKSQLSLDELRSDSIDDRTQFLYSSNFVNGALFFSAAMITSSGSAPAFNPEYI
jgi:hypothetical protein